MSDSDDKRHRADALWREGQRLHLAGDLEEAIKLYDASIALFPTAEAYTFRGWAFSAQGRLDEAIDECHQAIEVDPTFGNPYNDIGSYLLKKGEVDEAIGWLEKAKSAERYGPRHFPYMNLGRIYATQGMLNQAIDEFEKALELKPGDESCTRALEELRYALN